MNIQIDELSDESINTIILCRFLVQSKFEHKVKAIHFCFFNRKHISIPCYSKNIYKKEQQIEVIVFQLCQKLKKGRNGWKFHNKFFIFYAMEDFLYCPVHKWRCSFQTYKLAL